MYSQNLTSNILLFHDEPSFTDPVINMAIVRRGMKGFCDNSISATRPYMCATTLVLIPLPMGPAGDPKPSPHCME